MKKDVYLYILICFTLLLFTCLIVSLINKINKRKQFIWEQEYLKKQEQEKLAKEESKKYENSIVSVDNPFLLNLRERSRLFLFSGEPGNGKTESMKMFAKFLYDIEENNDYKNRTYNHYMRPDYLKNKKQLIDAGILNLYDNLGVTLQELRSQPCVLEILQQAIKASEKAILMLDEAGHDLPKEVYFEIQKNKNRTLKQQFEKVVQFVRFIRHYINGYLLMTEQDEDNIYIGVRRTGYKKINVLGCWHYLDNTGNRKLKLKTFLNRTTPSTFHKPIRQQFQLLGKKRRFINLLKLILFIPNFFNKRIYFEKQDFNREQLTEKYQLHKVLWRVDGREKYLIYDNSQTFKSDSRSKRGDYPKRFNSNGYSKEVA